MAAPKGNKNAEKWTEKTVLKILDAMYGEAIGGGIYHINALIEAHNLYPEIWSVWTNKFKDNKIVFQAIKKVEGILEKTIVTDAIKGETNATMSIFLLKNKYGYKDKQEVENTGNMSVVWKEQKTYEAEQETDASP